MKGCSFVNFDWNRSWQRSRSTSEARDSELQSVFLHLSCLYIKEKTDFGKAQLVLICSPMWDCINSTGCARSHSWNQRCEFRRDYWKVWLSEHLDCQVCRKAALLHLKCDFDPINVIYLTWQVAFLGTRALQRVLFVCRTQYVCISCMRRLHTSFNCRFSWNFFKREVSTFHSWTTSWAPALSVITHEALHTHQILSANTLVGRCVWFIAAENW